MKHLILDTSWLREHLGLTLKGGPYIDALSILASRNNVKIYIPAIVLEEFQNQIRENIQEISGKIRSAKKEYGRKGFPRNIIHLFEDLASEIEILQENYINDLSIKLKHMDAVILPYPDPSIVFKSYASGSLPFNGQKTRDQRRADIPDAFIWYTAIDLFENQTSTIFIVSRDMKFFSEPSMNNKNIKLTDVKTIIEDPVAQSILNDTQSSHVNKTKEFIKHNLQAISNGIFPFGIADYSILPFDFPPYGGRARIYKGGEVELLKGPLFYGNNRFYIQLRFSGRIETFYESRPHFEEMSREVMLQYIRDREGNEVFNNRDLANYSQSDLAQFCSSYFQPWAEVDGELNGTIVSGIIISIKNNIVKDPKLIDLKVLHQ